jgi:uncharacterized protein
MMQQETVLPIQSSKRTAIVDVLRGWAILGVVLGNYTDYAFIGKPVKIKYDMASNILMGLNSFVFAAKSWTLLSLLFGYGFAVVMNNIAAKGKSPVAFFTKRMFWLFVIAFINSAFWLGDILKDYAFLGLVLLLFYKASAKTAFWSGAILLFVVPFISALVAKTMPYDYDAVAKAQVLPTLYSHNWLDVFTSQLKGTYYLEVLLPQYAISVHVMMFACMLFGFAAQRIDFFNRLPELIKQLKKTFWIALASTVILSVGLGLLQHFKVTAIFTYFRPRYWVIFATLLTVATGICWLYTCGKLKSVFNGFQALGKMTLTNYMVQNILAVFLFLNVGLGMFNTYQYWVYFLIALVIFIIQIPLSKWWLANYNYGPVEWIWRQLSYCKWLPIKKAKT